MPNESTNLKLKLYDPDADADALVYDFLKDITGYTNSNFVKIDTSIKALQDSIAAAHPIGSIFLSTSDVEPAGLYGGTWEKIAEERTLMGASTAHPVNTTVEAGLPNIIGSFALVSNGVGGGWLAFAESSISGAFYGGNPGSGAYAAAAGVAEKSMVSANFSAARSNSIYGNSTTVQPATYYINIWKRIE